MTMERFSSLLDARNEAFDTAETNDGLMWVVERDMPREGQVGYYACRPTDYTSPALGLGHADRIVEVRVRIVQSGDGPPNT